MELLGSTKRNIPKDKNRENAFYLEIIEVALIQCNAVNNSYQKNVAL